MANIENILKYLSGIFTVFKRHEGIAEEIVEKRDIKNKRRAKKVELKNLRTEKKIARVKKKLGRKK